VVGSVNRDLVATLDRLPGPGETRTATGVTLTRGRAVDPAVLRR